MLLNGSWMNCPNGNGIDYVEHFVSSDGTCMTCYADKLATETQEAHIEAVKAKHGDNWRNVIGTELE